MRVTSFPNYKRNVTVASALLILANTILVNGTPFNIGSGAVRVAWISPPLSENRIKIRRGLGRSASDAFPTAANNSLLNREGTWDQRLSKFNLNAHGDDDNDATAGNDDDTSRKSTTPPSTKNVSRRNLLQSTSLGLFTSMISNPPKAAHAGLIQFPTPTLMNTYHLMRSGQSLLEEENLYMTNPLFLTNRENGLSQLGIEQAQNAAAVLESQDINPSLVKFTTAANSIDTADIIQTTLRIGRNRCVPEYTYMDPRGIGAWELLPLEVTEEAIWAMDVLEAGNDGIGGRPPPKDDGTPHEVLANQVTRLRQLISLLESTLSGDSILLIFPDGTGPAVLSCLFAGIPLNRVHELNFQPGEVRLDVNYNTAQAYLSAREQDAIFQGAYKEKINRGIKQLDTLRSNPNIMNERDLAYEQSVIAAKEKEKEAARLREEERKERIAAKEREKEEYRKREEERKKQILLEKQAEQERKIQEQNEKSKDGLSANDVFAGVGVAASALVFAALAGSSSSDSDKIADEKVLEAVEKEGDSKLSSEILSNITNVDEVSAVEAPSSNTTAATPSANIINVTNSNNDLSPEIQRMEELMERAPIRIPEITSMENDLASSSVAEEEESRLREKRADDAMQEYLDRDDGGDAWLEFITDLATEVDDALAGEGEQEELLVNGSNQNNTLSLS